MVPLNPRAQGASQPFKTLVFPARLVAPRAFRGLGGAKGCQRGWAVSWYEYTRPTRGRSWDSAIEACVCSKPSAQSAGENVEPPDRRRLSQPLRNRRNTVTKDENREPCLKLPCEPVRGLGL